MIVLKVIVFKDWILDEQRAYSDLYGKATSAFSKRLVDPTDEM